MALTQSSYVERILIVLNPDGTLKGAHQESLDIIRDGEAVISAKSASPVPLTAETLAGILDVSALAAQVQALTDQLAAATTAKTTAETERDSAVAAKAGLEAQIESLTAQLNPTDEAGHPVLTAVQVRLGLLAAGITTQQVDAVIAAIPDPVARGQAFTYWEYSTTMRRTHPLVAQLAAALGLTDEQVDQMWQAAAAIA